MKIVIIDDDPIVCQSLKMIIEKGSKEEIQVLATGKNGKEAIELFQKMKPDMLLLDIQMDEMSGLEACEIILKKDPQAKIIFLTTFLDEDYIATALRLGAKGYLMKSDVAHILPALYAVKEGHRVYGDEIIKILPTMMEEEPREAFQELTEKEWELVEEIAQGKSNKEIAKELFLSEGTVRNYLSVILDKLGLRDRTQLVVRYYKSKNSGGLQK